MTTILFNLFLYLYAGYLISNLFVNLLEIKEPFFFKNFHTSIKAPWSPVWTKVIFRLLSIISWPIITLIR